MIKWLVDPNYSACIDNRSAVPKCIGIHILFSPPQTIPRSYYEVAEIDELLRSKFRRITLPLLIADDSVRFH